MQTNLQTLIMTAYKPYIKHFPTKPALACTLYSFACLEPRGQMEQVFTEFLHDRSDALPVQPAEVLKH